MKLFAFLLVSLSLFFSAKSQTQGKNHLQLAAGMSRHGSGDLKGLAVSASFTHKIKNRLTVQGIITNTIHDGSYPIYFTSGSGRTIDGSIRYTTAGIQVATNLGYDLIAHNSHDLVISAGPLFRYQSTSLPDYYEINYPAGTGLPYPVIIFSHTTPQRTYSLGANLQLQYNYALSQRFTIGLLSGFQIDTNGDNILQAGLAGGLRF